MLWETHSKAEQVFVLLGWYNDEKFIMRLVINYSLFLNYSRLIEVHFFQNSLLLFYLLLCHLLHVTLFLVVSVELFPDLPVNSDLSDQLMVFFWFLLWICLFIDFVRDRKKLKCRLRDCTYGILINDDQWWDIFVFLVIDGGLWFFRDLLLFEGDFYTICWWYQTEELHWFSWAKDIFNELKSCIMNWRVEYIWVFWLTKFNCVDLYSHYVIDR